MFPGHNSDSESWKCPGSPLLIERLYQGSILIPLTAKFLRELYIVSDYRQCRHLEVINFLAIIS